MKNIRDLFDTYTPDRAQIDRIAEKIEMKKEELPRERKRPLKRVCTVMLAAVLTGIGTFTAAVYANPLLGETVRNILSREALIKDHAVQIGAQENREGISLTVEKAVRDGETVYLYGTLTRAQGTFEGDILTAEEIRLTRTVTETNRIGREVTRTYPVLGRVMGETGILAGEILKILPEEPGSAVQMIFPLNLGEACSGAYTLTLTQPFTAVSEPDGTFSRTAITDELSVSFTLEDLPSAVEVYEESPGTEIPLGGATVILQRVRISPMEVVVEISDPEGKTVAVPGYPELSMPVMDYLRSFYTLYPRYGEEPGKLTREEYCELTDLAYRIRVDFRDGVSSVDPINSYGSYTQKADGTVTEFFRLNYPIYPEDVERITLYCSGTGDEIVIWEFGK